MGRLHWQVHSRDAPGGIPVLGRSWHRRQDWENHSNLFRKRIARFAASFVGLLFDKHLQQKPLITSSCMCVHPLSLILSFLSPRVVAVIGVCRCCLVSLLVLPPVSPLVGSRFCLIGVLFAAAAFSPTKRDIATTSIHSNPNGNSSDIENRHDFNI